MTEPQIPSPDEQGDGDQATRPKARAQARRGKDIPRAQVVRRLLSRFDKPHYLEIGVNRGQTFTQVRAARLVAVDPNFLFDPEAEEFKRKHATYHSMTSDEYFGTVIGPDELFDVIFVDGLHTFEQTLRDFLNALEHLAPRGVIVIDDVRPPYYDASLPDHDTAVKVRDIVGQTKQVWMGDVYRLVWFIDTFCQHLSFRTVSNNHGQAVVWREQRPSVVDRTVRSIAELSFEEFLLNPEVLRLAPFAEIFRELEPVIGRGLDETDGDGDTDGDDTAAAPTEAAGAADVAEGPGKGRRRGSSRRWFS